MRYLLAFLAAIGLIVVVFILILRGLGGQRTPPNAIELLDYASSDTVVQLTVDGPIKADQDRQSYTITVGRDQTVFELMQGYEGKVVDKRTYANNSTSYADFLVALQKLGFIKGNPDPKKADERGYCPNGSRYIYKVVSDNHDVKRFWSSSCGDGTFRGDNGRIRTLFLRQAPDYPKVLRNFSSGS